MQADNVALLRRYDDAQTAEELSRDVFAPWERVTLRLHVDRLVVHGFHGEE